MSILALPRAASGALALTRRAALLGLSGAITFGRSRLALASPATEQRLVVVLLRGALDGLFAVQPYGDPALADLRGDLALPAPGKEGGLHDLGGFYGLHPSLAGMASLYKAGDLAIAHAIAGHYRDRSHFAAQDYLESGADRRLSSGWLNRVAALLPARPGKTPGVETALAVGNTVGVMLRGPAPVGAWLPQSFGKPDAGLYQALARLHAADPVTGTAVAEGLKERGFTAAVLNGSEPQQDRFSFPTLAAAVGKLLASADGPRIAAMEMTGWDTHNAQLARLPGVLTQLDRGITALRENAGESWRRTAVLVLTEFGRTAAINGTKGTDHGTGTVAFLAGGAVAGGRVIADWPGLGAGKLYENRDLMPTADLRSFIKGVLAAHYRFDGARLAGIFPDSADASPTAGLLRT